MIGIAQMLCTFNPIIIFTLRYENNYIVRRETGETENDIEPIKTNNIDTHTNLLDFLNDGTI